MSAKSTKIIIAICLFVREVTCRDIRHVDVERVYETLECNSVAFISDSRFKYGLRGFYELVEELAVIGESVRCVSCGVFPE